MVVSELYWLLEAQLIVKPPTTVMNITPFSPDVCKQIMPSDGTVYGLLSLDLEVMSTGAPYPEYAFKLLFNYLRTIEPVNFFIKKERYKK